MSFDHEPSNGRYTSVSMGTSAGMKRLAGRFPELQTQIERLVILYPDFREICADYEEVFQALDHWRLTPSPDSVRMIEDYERLLRELETEALEYVYRNATQN